MKELSIETYEAVVLAWKQRPEDVYDLSEMNAIVRDLKYDLDLDSWD